MGGTYRKVGKMESEHFSPMLDLFHTDLIKIIYGCLLEGSQATNRIKTELYKLNVYGAHSIFIHLQLIPCCYPGKGSFFKSHLNTPRTEKMFGSLVIVFPTPHEGGVFILRHHGHEWIFDSGKELAQGQPSIGYVAFFSDVEHEVAPVTSGHRITLTYNLYFDDSGPVSANHAVSGHLALPQPENEGAFRDAFLALLENPEFLADGGTLAFGLRNVYPIKNNIKHVYSILKGSDAVVYRGARALGFEPTLYVFYEAMEESWSEGVIIDRVIDFHDIYVDDDLDNLFCTIDKEGGLFVNGEDGSREITDWGAVPEQLAWVTPRLPVNRQKDSCPSLYGGWLTWNVCLVVRIGMAGERLVYPTVAELNRRNRVNWEGT